MKTREETFIVKKDMSRSYDKRTVSKIINTNKMKNHLPGNENKFNCLVVDDEQLGQDIIVAFLNLLPSIGDILQCGSTKKAREILNEQQVDILILDINMPEESGIQLASSLPTQNQPTIIFCTAHFDYVEISEFIGATDYLVKPVRRERFNTAIQKAIDQIEKNKSSSLNYLN